MADHSTTERSLEPTPTAAAPTATLETVDVQAGTYGQGYTCTVVVHWTTDGSVFTIRARVRADAYPHQSHAVAEVLTPQLTWTDIVTIPPSEWHSELPSYLAVDTSQQADEVLSELTRERGYRAAAILTSSAVL